MWSSFKLVLSLLWMEQAGGEERMWGMGLEVGSGLGGISSSGQEGLGCFFSSTMGVWRSEWTR